MGLAYFDCFAGAAGDMIVGALLDAGANFDSLQQQLTRLSVAGLAIRKEAVTRGGISGTKFHVDVDHHEHAHRGLSDVLAIIQQAKLSQRVTSQATDIFTRLAKAEAKVHHVDIQAVHFHEVGAIDSIADIVGACIAMELLGIDTIICSPIPLGCGTVACAHGVLPVPPPATAELMIGAAIAPCEIKQEMTTPTAAAILTTLTTSYGPMPAMDVQAVGYGAGSRNSGDIPNLLRVYVGRQADDSASDSVVELSANIDDCSGELLGATIEKLISAGCVDAWASPIVMKKSRPAWLIGALCFHRDVAAAEAIIFAETTTFGIRRHPCGRSKLRRHYHHVETPYGPIRIKVGTAGNLCVTASPEFADCAAAASAHHVAVKEVMAEASFIYRQQQSAQTSAGKVPTPDSHDEDQT
jgi:uncharacterized protein (TIGR00299 family) protein